MIRILARFFIHSEDSFEKQRETYGVLCAGVGIFLNLILFLGKLFAGMISHSIAITADAFNNLSDAGSSIISMVGFKLAGQKPDRQHPYGHGRLEYLAGLAISGIIVVMAYELLSNSIHKIFYPQSTEFSYIIVGILVISILVKCYMAYYNFSVGKKISSATVRAVAIDSLSDCIATTVVLLSLFVSHYAKIEIDGYAGVIVGLFIGYAGINAAKDVIGPLLGQEPEEDFVKSIEEIVLSFDENIVGIHDLMVHDYGPGRRIISLHAEVPADGNIMMLHDVIDQLEEELYLKLGCMATIHMDPIAVNDPYVAALREKLENVLVEFGPEVKMHDFRVVIGESHTNLVFDAVLPFGYSLTDDAFRQELQGKIWEKMGKQYFCVIKIDKY